MFSGICRSEMWFGSWVCATFLTPTKLTLLVHR